MVHENEGCGIIFLIGIALFIGGVALYASWDGVERGREQANTEWREYLIERDMAHWSVDPATGEVTFVLEEPEHDAERSD